MTVGAVLLDSRQIHQMVDCSDTDDIVVHIPVQLNTGTVTVCGMLLSAVLTHQGAFTSGGATAKTKEIEFVLALTCVGRAGTEEMSGDESLRPGRVDETGVGRRGRRATN
jgi:hypothetical protein